MSIGRLRKKNVFVCPHPDLSGSHATFFQDGVVDHSTNGTFLIMGDRSAFAKVYTGTRVRIGDFDIDFF